MKTLTKTLTGGFWGAVFVASLLALWGLSWAGPAGAVAMVFWLGMGWLHMGFVVGSLVGFVVSLFPERVAARTVSRDNRWDEDDD